MNVSTLKQEMKLNIYFDIIRFLTLLLMISNTIEADNNICCVPEEWEGTMFLDYGTVFIDSNTAFSYINGTVHAAYSVPLKKIYFGVKGVEQSPLIPKPVAMDTILLYDFSKGILYNVVENECEKSQLDNMTQQCIPVDAKILSKGVLGGDPEATITTYQYTTSSDLTWQVTATVQETGTRDTCKPVHVTYFVPSVNPDSGALYSLDVFDIGPIRSTDIFNVPKQCL